MTFSLFLLTKYSLIALFMHYLGQFYRTYAKYLCINAYKIHLQGRPTVAPAI